MGAKACKETTSDGRSIYERESLGSIDHEGSINCMALTEDGSLLITGSEDCTARLWSTKTDDTECLGTLRGHTSYITCVTSMDSYLVTGSADSTIRKWDMFTLECLFVYQGHKHRVSNILACEDFIFSSSYDKTARVWHFDTSEGEKDEFPCYKVYQGHQGAVYPILFIQTRDSSDSSDSEDDNSSESNMGILLTGSVDRTAKSWNLHGDTCSSLRTFRGHDEPVSCMVADGDGTTLFTAGPDRTIRIWDIASAICQQTMDSHEQSIVCMQLVNKLLYSGSADKTARCWVTEFADCTRTYKSHTHSVICLKVADGVVFTGCGDSLVRAFDAKSGALKRTFKGHGAAINCLQYIDGKLYTGSSDGALKVWDAKNIADDPPPEKEECGEPCKQHLAEQDKRLKEVNRRLSAGLQEEHTEEDIDALEREANGFDTD